MPLRFMDLPPRLLLADLSFFGCAETLTLRQRLAVAYRDFRQRLKANQVQCGQPLFRESMVSCPYRFFTCDFNI